MRSGRNLIFVFNCDRGNLSAIRDYSQKPADGRAPGCHLLDLISSPVGIKKAWKRYIQELAIPCRFLHHDEYEEEFGALLTPLPAVFLYSYKTMSLFISADELRRILTVEELTDCIDQKLGAMQQGRSE
jgi:hypothetical protein